MQGNQTGRHTFLMLAGVYLLYLSWQLFSGFKNGEAKNPVFILAAVLFAVIGVMIIVSNIKAIVKLSKETPAAGENTANDTDAADAAEDNTETAAAAAELVEDASPVTSEETPADTTEK